MNDRFQEPIEPTRRFQRRPRPLQVAAPPRVRVALRGLVVVLLHAGLVALAAWCGVRITERLVGSEEFAVGRIQLEGVEHASRAEVMQRLDPYLGASLLDVDLQAVERRVDDHRWVRSSSVRRILPDVLRVTVQERVPQAIAVLDGRPWLADETGELVGPLGEAPHADLPVLTGIDEADREKLRVRLAAGVALLQRLAEREPVFARQLSELDLAAGDRVVARLSGNEPPLLLDPERIERNVEAYLELRQPIDRRVGRADYVDLRWQGRISVMPSDREKSERGDT